MLKVGIVDDELNDLLGVAGNLVAFDPSGERIAIVPVLLSDDREGSVTKQEEWRWRSYAQVLNANGISNFSFPKIKALPALDATKQNEAEAVLRYLADQN